MAELSKFEDGLRGLQAIASDVDGVLTDGSLTWLPNGDELKSFSFTDVMGISLLRRLGFQMGLISGEATPFVDMFAKKIKIPFVAKGISDKAAAIKDFAAKFNLDLAKVCFFGDDVNDLPAMELAGMCACPANAASEVLRYVSARAAAGTGFVSEKDGGHGAMRSFADAVLSARGLSGRDVFKMPRPE